MNYLILKTIIANVLSTFDCPACRSRATEQSVFVRGWSQEGATFLIDCPHCHKKTEVQASFKIFGGQSGAPMQPMPSPFFADMPISTSPSAAGRISDESIRSLHTQMGSAQVVSDLFGDQP